jgi:hypothetical protein
MQPHTQSLSLRRNTTKTNLQDISEPSTPVPPAADVYGGDDILLLISGTMGVDRNVASVLCQALLDR